jgi:adenine phosphoribosyltransferase
VSDGLKPRLLEAYRSRGGGADPSGWWRSAALLAAVAHGLAELHRDGRPTVVAGIPSRGSLLGPVTALALGVGFVEIRKDLKEDGEHGLGVLRRVTPPDYAQRDLTLTLRRGLLGPRDRVVLVDDWIATGAQATAARSLVQDARAEWIGVAAVVDGAQAGTRWKLNARSLLRVAELPD